MDTVHQLQPTSHFSIPGPLTTDDNTTDVQQNEGNEKNKPTVTSQELIPSSSSAHSSSTGPTSDQKILALLRQSILPFSDRLDPFAALPVRLDRLQEHLVSFYLLYYPKVTYGFSPRLRPHPVATNFSIALTTPACFQVILARSALYRLSLSKYAGENEKRALEVVMMRHKGEALRLIRMLSAKSSPTRKDDLIASIISLGTLDKRTGSNDAAGMHFMAVRRILKATGGPLAVRSLLLSRVMVFFETIYGTSPDSYIWDESDLAPLIVELNAFFGRIWALWKHNSALAEIKRKEAIYTSTSSMNVHSPIEPYLQPGSALHSILSRSPGPAEPSEATPILPQHRLELVSQLTCLLTLAAVILDYESLPPSARASTFTATSPRARSVSATTTSYFPSASSSSGRRSSTSATSTVAQASTRLPPATVTPSAHLSRADTSSTISTSTYLVNPSPSTPSPSIHRPLHPQPRAPRPQNRPLQPRTRPPHPQTRPHPHPNPQPQPQHQQPSALHTYLTNLHNSIDHLSLHIQPSNNTMWQIQINDHSEAHSRRVWKAAGYAWVLKHVSWNVQREVGGWLLRFMTWESVQGRGPGGVEKETEKVMRLSSFHFSYAA